ncbi:MAG: DUF418 domain-containing protein [Pseudomonadota bacterium]
MSEAANIGPVARADRIDVIDVLRGVAILGILHLNMPLANNVPWEIFAHPSFAGWSELDQTVWVFQHVFTQGTMRGMLQLLFGAGLMLVAAKAMAPDGPVGVADVWYRRNFWLMAFGAFNAFILLWPGDILFIYGAAAILLFPFRLLKAKWLMAIAAAYLAFTVYTGATGYLERAERAAVIETAITLEEQGGELSEVQSTALKSWNERVEAKGMNPEFEKRAKEHRAAVADPDPMAYIAYSSSIWLYLWSDGDIVFMIIEAFFTMILGMALFKTGFIQGGASSRIYWIVMMAGYALGWGARSMGVPGYFTTVPEPALASALGNDIPRIAISLAHIAAINLLMRGFAAGALTASLGAAGRIAFTIYLMQSFIMQYVIGAPFALGLFDQMNWARVFWVSGLIMAVQVVFAMWWLARFRFGPLEWLWRSLTHWKRQPMRLEDAGVEKGSFGPQPAQ